MFCARSVSSEKATVNIYTEQKEYVVGELIRGNVEIEVHKPLKHNGISVACNCLGHVKWKMYTGRALKIFEYKHALFSQEYVLVPKGELGVGTFIFPVLWQLDPTHPATFQYSSSCLGTVNYTIKTQIEIPGIFTSNVINEVNVLVKPCPEPIRPVIAAQSVHASTCCSNTGVVGVYAMIPKETYAPGEHITFFIDFDTLGLKSDIKSVSVRLTRCLIFRKSRQNLQKRFIKRKCLDQQSLGRVKKEFKERLQVSLKIPQDVAEYPSTDTDILECKYYIKVELEFALFISNSFKMHLKIAPPSVAGIPVA